MPPPSCHSPAACHLDPDLLHLLSPRSSPPSPLRPKAAAATLRALSLCPDVVPPLFKPLVECLSSPDLCIVSATVGTFAELASSGDPSPYLPLAPKFYRVLADSRSNWILIKLLKIFACLTPREPRLVARLVDPLCDLLRRSSARCLIFECIHTVFSGLADHDHTVCPCSATTGVLSPKDVKPLSLCTDLKADFLHRYQSAG